MFDYSLKFKDAKCLSNNKCSHLSGDCCPIKDGVYLDCCYGKNKIKKKKKKQNQNKNH